MYSPPNVGAMGLWASGQPPKGGSVRLELLEEAEGGRGKPTSVNPLGPGAPDGTPYWVRSGQFY